MTDSTLVDGNDDPVSLPDEEDIASWFSDHQKPDESIDVRVHILSDDKKLQLETFMVSAIPDCYISESDMTARIA